MTLPRRRFLLGAATLAAAAAGGVVLWKPGDRTRGHDAYFGALNELLKREGPGRPVLVVDRSRLHHNIDVIAGSVGPDRTYRVVVKSLPSVPLLGAVMARARTRALMVFHQPFLNAIAAAFPDADVLMGKPMPVNAVRTFYRTLPADSAFDPARQVQWLVDTPERLAQYRQLATELGVRMRVNLEIDVGLHRGGFPSPEALHPVLADIAAPDAPFELAGLMGYEAHLSGSAEHLSDAPVQATLAAYRGCIDALRAAGADPARLTLNGAGSHTLRLYEQDRTMNDLSAGSGIVMPTDFDTPLLADNVPALFIATPVLKRYDHLVAPVPELATELMQWWDPNRQRLYFIYGGYWKARYVSPSGVPDPIYHSTNQEPLSTSASVDLRPDDLVFLRPTQSEHVMLQFGDLLVVDGHEIVDRWPVFTQGHDVEGTCSSA